MSFIAVTVDPACRIDDAEVARACLAVDEQARELAALHGFEYTPVIPFAWDVLEKLDGEDLTAFIKGARLLTVLTDIGVPGAAGFHDHVAGVIFARVKAGDDWTVTFSHEVLEEIGDPTCDLYAPLSDGTEQALEMCDRVEGDTYRINGVLVSNYLLPSAFVPDSTGPWDKLGQLTKWDGMTGGGYTIVRRADGSEVNVWAETDHARAAADRKRAKASGRLARRLAGVVAHPASMSEPSENHTHVAAASVDSDAVAQVPAPKPAPKGKGRGKGKAARA